MKFPIGKAYFQWQTVSFREGISLPLRVDPFMPTALQPRLFRANKARPSQGLPGVFFKVEGVGTLPETNPASGNP